VSTGLAIAAGGLLIASIVQAATGFGFALIAGPVLYTVVEPSAAVALVLILGQVVNVLVLFGERRRPEIDWTAVRPALAAAGPGLPIGALIVTVVPDTAMRLAVGGIVCTVVLVRVARRRRRHRRAAVPGRGAAIAAGFAVGVLTTSTTTNGPPLAVWLTARRMEPRAIRDVVTVIFFVLDIVGIAVLVAVSGTDSLARADWIPALLPVAVAGHFLGRQVFVRLPDRHYEPIVLGSAFVAGALSIATAIAGR
jgi:uncharacterized membrane protein YfcA